MKNHSGNDVHYNNSVITKYWKQ